MRQQRRSLAAGVGATLVLIAAVWSGVGLVPGAPARASVPVQRVLAAVSARSATDIWAVGARNRSTLIRHWNGSKWSDVASPNPGAAQNLFSGVTTRTATDAWAVGFSTAVFAGASHTLIAWRL